MLQEWQVKLIIYMRLKLEKLVERPKKTEEKPH